MQIRFSNWGRNRGLFPIILKIFPSVGSIPTHSPTNTKKCSSLYPFMAPLPPLISDHILKKVSILPFRQLLPNIQPSGWPELTWVLRVYYRCKESDSKIGIFTYNFFSITRIASHFLLSLTWHFACIQWQCRINMINQF